MSTLSTPPEDDDKETYGRHDVTHLPFVATVKARQRFGLPTTGLFPALPPVSYLYPESSRYVRVVDGVA